MGIVRYVQDGVAWVARRGNDDIVRGRGLYPGEVDVLALHPLVSTPSNPCGEVRTWVISVGVAMLMSATTEPTNAAAKRATETSVEYMFS